MEISLKHQTPDTHTEPIFDYSLYHTGWINPEGVFYKCELFEHDALAGKILKQLYNIDNGSSKELTQLKWLSISEGSLITVLRYIDFCPTQAQLNMVNKLYGRSREINKNLDLSVLQLNVYIDGYNGT